MALIRYKLDPPLQPYCEIVLTILKYHIKEKTKCKGNSKKMTLEDNQSEIIQSQDAIASTRRNYWL